MPTTYEKQPNTYLGQPLAHLSDQVQYFILAWAQNIVVRSFEDANQGPLGVGFVMDYLWG